MRTWTVAMTNTSDQAAVERHRAVQLDDQVTQSRRAAADAAVDEVAQYLDENLTDADWVIETDAAGRIRITASFG